MNDCRVIAYGTIVGCVCEVIKDRRMDRGGIRGNIRGKLILEGKVGEWGGEEYGEVEGVWKEYGDGAGERKGYGEVKRKSEIMRVMWRGKSRVKREGDG